MSARNLVLLGIDNAEAVIGEMIHVLSSVENGMEKMAVRAIKRTLRQGVTITKRMVSAEFMMTQADVAENLEVTDPTYSHLEGRIDFSGRAAVPLIEYVLGSKEPVPTMPRFYRTPEAERVKGVKVKVRRTKKPVILKKHFLARMKSGHVGVFERSGESRLPIDEGHTHSFLQYLNRDLVADELEERVWEKFEDNVMHEASYVLQQAGLR